MAKEGDRVRVVGMPGYENKIGTVIGLTGSGLHRVQLDRSQVVVGADTWQVRVLSLAESVAAENLPPVEVILREMRRMAQEKGSQDWSDAANFVAQKAKDYGLQ